MGSSAQGLFANNEETLPLAERARPHSFDEMIPPPGVDAHLLETWKRGKGRPPSLILWGPPGSGKTTLARVLGNTFKAEFHELSAVSVGVKEVREVTKRAESSLAPTILFLDEVHRFNKAQQDVLLPWIEKGTISFIGATTENPTFSLNGALLSRCEVVHLTGFGEETLLDVIDRALSLKGEQLTSEEKGMLLQMAQGDARAALRTLEAFLAQRISGGVSLREFLISRSNIHYDRDGDQHFDSISAFIKSMRAGDTD
ncbi:MAG: AAA family ATPase, partial [Bdellovibrionales bacterium]|nr:AAA family ATPase [Bdellovibrionales bacterium]